MVVVDNKTVGELTVYEALMITLLGLALANLLSDALRTLFFTSFNFNENSLKDKAYALLLPLLFLFFIISIFKPSKVSLF